MKDVKRKKIASGKLRLVENSIKAVDAAKAEYKRRMDALIENKNRMTPGEYVASEKWYTAELKNARDNHAEALRAALVDFKEIVTEDRQHLDLSGPELNNAVQLINSLGPDANRDVIAQINAAFGDDQAKLQVLRNAYKAKGINHTDLESRTYDPDIFDELQSQVTASVYEHNHADLNDLADKVAHVAECEGIPFDGPKKNSLSMEILERTGLRNREKGSLREAVNKHLEG